MKQILKQTKRLQDNTNTILRIQTTTDSERLSIFSLYSLLKVDQAVLLKVYLLSVKNND